MSARNQSLDVLRGIAVLLVICYHFPLVPVLSQVGWCGVDLFFVLSGYLIAGLLFRELQTTGTIQLKRFWLRRGFKIWPSLYIFLLLMVPWLMKWHHVPQWPSLRASALFYANYRTPVPLVSHTWSLAVEEHFYIALPLLFILLVRFRKMATVPWIAVSALIVCAMIRTASPLARAYSWTQCRIDALLVGVALQYAREFEPKIFGYLARSRNLVIAALLLSSLALSQRHMSQFGFPCLSLSFALITAWASEHDALGKLLRPLVLIGFYSYSVYLWQEPFSVLYGLWPGLVGFVVLGSLAILFGIAMASIIEIPALRIRDRFLPADRAWTQPSVISYQKVSVGVPESRVIW